MKTAVAETTASAPAETAEVTEQSLAAQIAAEMANEEAANTPKAGSDAPGAEAEETEDDESPAESAEEADEAEALSQAEESGKTEEAEATEETPEAEADEAEETPAPEEPTKAPRIGELLDEIEALKPEEREAINERVNQVVRDRVGKVNAKLTEAKAALEAAEQRASAAEAKAQESPATSAPRNADNPLGHVQTEADLQKEAAKAESALDDVANLLPEVDANPEWVAGQLKASKVVLKDSSGEEDYSPARMRAFLERVKAGAERNLRKHIPAKAQELTARKTFEDEAVTKFPVLKDSQHVFTKRVNDMLKTLPEIASLPYGKLLLATSIYGANEMAKAQAAAKKPATPPLAKTVPPKVKPPVVASRAAGKPTPKEGAKSAALIAAEKRFADSGSDKDLIALEALRG